jgi:phosphatidylserine decarboxylase
MKFHKEGYTSLVLAVLAASLFIWVGYSLDEGQTKFFFWLGITLGLALIVTILQFFRNPIRNFKDDERGIISPADGKIVVIEKVKEDEYLHEECVQISVFMSPINVHINRYPISGTVEYFRYHPGKYLVAWHPKSSTDNERTTTVLSSESLKCRILFRQIAGALARRIVWYCKEGMQVRQNQEMGFIKFGSRVDIFIPQNSQILVKPGQIVTGGITILARLP